MEIVAERKGLKMTGSLPTRRITENPSVVRSQCFNVDPVTRAVSTFDGQDFKESIAVRRASVPATQIKGEIIGEAERIFETFPQRRL